MAFLEVHINPNLETNSAIPYLLDVQADLLSSLETCVVVPLYSKSAAPRSSITRLTPILTFQGQSYVAMIPELAGIARHHLGKTKGHLTSARNEIIGALDILFTGI